MTDLEVQLVATTQFHLPVGVPWKPDIASASYQYSDDPAYLIEFAGRACYQSWNRPNVNTATVAGYIAHLIEVGHLSVLEHASASFYIRGITRSLSHELVRHRHFSYSQLSQRYVDSGGTEFIMPPEAVGDAFLEAIIADHHEKSLATYDDIVNHLMEKLKDEPGTSVERRKRARQTARAVLGNDVETQIVMTGNYRAWRHFIRMRATAGADTEIRKLAVKILLRLQEFDPAVFGDFTLDTHTDGTLIASTEVGQEQ
jgi:thymidylate synthase (FAD)